MSKNKKPFLIAGPTASGKTDVALALAQLCGGEIISVDSRQVYKLIKTGTAAPEGCWENGIYKTKNIPYHLVDFLDLNKNFDVSEFCDIAGKITATDNQKQFIFAGGTGMYMQGYFCGMDNLPPADGNIRKELSALAEKNGRQYLHAKLAEIDAQSAAAIPAGNIHRVIRALEIYKLTGKPASVLRTGKFKADLPQDKVLAVYLHWQTPVLEQRIRQRTEKIFNPMVEEARLALAFGYKEDCPGLKSLGYREAISYMKGEISKEQAIERIYILTRQYAKRQRTWFKRYKTIKILDCEKFKTPLQAAEQILLWKE